MKSLLEDLQEDMLRDALEKPATRSRKKEEVKRFTDWNNFASFEHKGWIALCREETCECCGSRSRHSLGVFAVEQQRETGARRLTRARDWPQEAARVMEVEYVTVDYCFTCLVGLGFDNLVEAPQTKTLRVGGPE